jgi:hypothetical protein
MSSTHHKASLFLELARDIKLNAIVKSKSRRRERVVLDCKHCEE